ncbi:hypothetical protein [Mycobacteroides abscessus]|uniref:hypothetical protein n=1 Tax=Mycobacteroides abscessus TaxID=36809 RepID=UPI0009C4E2AD|nr:hypothetical protein [Mycobacteroides abscessus]SKD80945.1 Uncharacterised protein [Mycobacteroides abscessus subsp. massiliense]SKH39001.1 Uncharacterised protein [Mycobacteroides abscessus subsp. massiliense]SKI31351.1 Uncharacterised protein [Mycobacteroides abscessus subsp. massiliense]SKJ17300.1 Uncharacterised protein [Mycobacteroides abscessus subsp. massiliense]SKJ90411.1 Uncharacterised protein [Mycobacteroides abscessus subsp. massiliense]
MSSVVPVLAVLACPVGMAAMMWTMMRGRGGTETAQSRELAALRDEIAQLKAQRSTM